MKRTSPFLAAVLAIMAPLASQAEQSVTMPRIGILRPASAPDPFVAAFRRGLHDLGYVENISIEYKWADGRPEHSIPIVMPVSGNPVRIGLVASVAGFIDSEPSTPDGI